MGGIELDVTTRQSECYPGDVVEGNVKLTVKSVSLCASCCGGKALPAAREVVYAACVREDETTADLLCRTCSTDEANCFSTFTAAAVSRSSASNTEHVTYKNWVPA